MGWWLSPLLGERSSRKLASEVQENLPLLFLQHAARVVPNVNKHSRQANYKIVTVAVDGILLRFSRDRGDFRVDIAPSHAPNDWQELAGAVREVAGSHPENSYYGLRGLDRLLQDNFDALRSAMSEANYGPPQRDRSIIRLTRL